MVDSVLIYVEPTDTSPGSPVYPEAAEALRRSILRALRAETGKKVLPTSMLYDEKGLELYDDITTHAGDHYYLFPAEEYILMQHASDIISLMYAHDSPSAGVLLELGSGSLRKTAHLISALSARQTHGTPSRYTYYALDLAPISLTRSLASLAPIVQGNVELKGLVADYDSGLQWIRDGGLERERFKPHDNEVNRGRSVRPTQRLTRLPNSNGISEPADISTQANVHPVPTTSAPAVLPEEGSRIPDPRPPPTPPHSQSRPTSPCGTEISENGPEQPADNKERDEGNLHVLFLGSSLGNFDRSESANFLRSLPLRPGSGDTLLLGLDGTNDKERVERAYNDPEGYTAAFIMNGIRITAATLGIGECLVEKFEYVGIFNEAMGRHEAYFRAKEDIVLQVPSDNSEDLETISFTANELVNIEYSYKYSDSDASMLFAQSNLRPITRWQDPQSLYSLWLLERPPLSFPLTVHAHASSNLFNEFAPTPSSSATGASTPNDMTSSLLERALTGSSNSPAHTRTVSGLFGTPSLTEFRELWKLWDEITLQMIPRSMLLEKPIDLRHMCLFYLGHIPAFLDIHLSRLLGEPYSEPIYFKDIFERGIDPDVDDPTRIHPHSEVPTSPKDWPSLASILAFRDRVRSRVVCLYDAIERGEEKVVRLGRKVHRVLWMCLEHEGWHAETLLYMLIQRAGTPGGTIPPSKIARPVWLRLPRVPSLAAVPSTTATLSPDNLISLPAQAFTIGHDDLEAEDLRHFTPTLTDHEFGWDNEHPARLVEIKKPIKVEKRCVSNAEYAAFLSSEVAGKRKQPASWVRDDEGLKVRTLYGPVAFSIAAEWPFVSSYDDLEAYAKWKGGRIPDEIELRAFMDQYLGAESSNIGFREWSFVRPEEPDPVKGRRGHNGGVWEWTSSSFTSYDGFVASNLYPGYSSDFFDGVHNVVLGGSFATIPRIAQRRTVRNYYQHNYPYAWVGGRVVYDI